MSREIPLTRGKVALVDDEDYERLSAFKWHAVNPRGGSRWYAVRNVKGTPRTIQRMHRAIVGTTMDVDHINGDGLDNRRCNLRPCTNSENAMNRRRANNNTSGYKGVSFARREGLWAAQIMVNQKQKHLGYFATPEAAAVAYREAAIRLFGEFARLG